MNTSIYLYQNYGAFYDQTGAGITGPVKLKSAKSGTSVDLSSQQWTYQVSVLTISFSFAFFLKKKKKKKSKSICPNTDLGKIEVLKQTMG